MKLTPMDINNKEFKKGLRGYNPDEVDEFLDEIVDNYEELFKENATLKEKINSMNEKVEHYAKIETTIQNTLLLAQNAADQAKKSAQKEAELVISNANEVAKKTLDKAQSAVVQVTEEYEKVKQEFIKFRAKYRNFMNAQLETFDDLEKDFIKNYNVSEPVEEEHETHEKAIELNNTEDVKSTSEEKDDVIKADELDEIKSFFVQE